VKANLVRLAKSAAEFLVEEHGFVLANARFTKVDQLARSVWFWPTRSAAADVYSFDVLMDVGIPELSPITSKAQEWVVRASCEKAYLRLWEPPQLNFQFQGGNYDSALEAAVLAVLRRICDDFFLRLDSRQQLFDFVERNAREFFELGMAADNEFKRYDLNPWNVVPRLQLAAVYAAFLGRTAAAAELSAHAIVYAEKHRIDHSNLTEHISRAAALGSSSRSGNSP
jgi:hypothetical protein